MQGLTKRQREIIDFIERYLAEKKHSPSYRDIQRHFNFSSIGSVFNHLQSLKKKGLIPADTKSPRSMVVKEKEKAPSHVPLIGTLRGGFPIETAPQTILIPHSNPPPNSFYLRIVGNELNEEWMREGDLILVKRGSEYDENSLVLAQVGSTTFIKRIRTTLTTYRLESENPEVYPLILRKEHVTIIGVVITLIRNYS